jgi:hypothetical protein
MMKLTKTQRDQLLAIAMGTVGVIAALWFFVVNAQYVELAATSKKIAEMKKKLTDAGAVIREADQINTELNRNLDILKAREATFAPEHDPYSWMEETTARFLLPPGDTHRYKTATITDIKTPEITDKGVIGSFPYRWARFHITGQGYYHDFGKFIADFENHFTYCRIENLEVYAPTIREVPETLSFNFDIVTPQVSSAPDTK